MEQIRKDTNIKDKRKEYIKERDFYLNKNKEKKPLIGEDFLDRLNCDVVLPEAFSKESFLT